MKPGGLLKRLILLFAIVLALYVVAYSAIEHRRTRNGPWRVAFTSNPAGIPAIVIDQPVIGITNVQIRFPGAALPQAGLPSTLIFDQPRPVPYDVPCGRCLFMDTTFLPGTVVLELFGHEIQLIPRVLTIDRRERPWKSGETITIETARP